MDFINLFFLNFKVILNSQETIKIVTCVSHPSSSNGNIFYITVVQDQNQEIDVSTALLTKTWIHLISPGLTNGISISFGFLWPLLSLGFFSCILLAIYITCSYSSSIFSNGLFAFSSKKFYQDYSFFVCHLFRIYLFQLCILCIVLLMIFSFSCTEIFV